MHPLFWIPSPVIWLTPLWLSLLLLAGCQNASPSSAPPLVQSQAWRIDPNGQDALEQVETATDWQVLPDWKNWGFGAETVWVRLRLNAAPSGSTTPWAVRIRPAYLDHVTLYDPSAGLVLHTGDALPPSGDDMTSINFTLQIPPLPVERTVYLQMRTTSSRVLNVQVLPYAHAQRLNRMQEWMVGFVTVLSALFSVWSFVQWCFTREALLGIFALKQFMASGWSFFYLGFGRMIIGHWLPEGVLSALAAMVGVGTVCATLWFIQVLLKPYRPSPLAFTALQAITVATAGLLLLQAGGQIRLMLYVLNHCLLLSFAVLMLCVLTTLPRQVKQPIPVFVLLIYFLFYTSLNSLPTMVALGWTDAGPVVLYGYFAHVLLDGLVMFILLQIRSHALRKEREQIALDFQRNQQATEDAKRHREEQSQLFTMLAHEMKTPLATLRMWMDAGQFKRDAMERAIMNMNQVIERCVHTGQLADQRLQAVSQHVNPVEITRNSIMTCRAPDRVDWSAPETDTTLQTDAHMLSIVLDNLLDNACKYGASQSRIQVSLTTSLENGRAGWLWSVTNLAGPVGLPEANHLFEKYYRSPQARRFSGSGLGLFLVKSLLNLLHGSIHYTSHDNHAVFSVWMPLHPDERW